MNIVPAKVRQVLADESGATIVEYGLLIVAVIAVAGIVLATLSGEVKDLFSGISEDIATTKTKIEAQGAGG
ncbi:Flp family type IVb pilin [Xanthobacter sp. TB0139]|uniref:Flp family type IVb pilin n=1 Tax=Xanthobacter sp. TB0139 TaxID=3459178 RepID=UPI0040393716